MIRVLDAEKCIITSGYRYAEHDKNVGGNGYGQHTKGTAADTCFYDKNGNPISSKIVSCKAQDLDFGGIANITQSYIYTHLYVRKNNFYKGDEVYGTSNVTSDFYKYFGLSKADVYGSSSDKTKFVKLIIDDVEYSGTLTAK